MSNKLNKIIIATGGSGGHVFPAYCLARHLIDKRINVKIISDKRGIRFLKDYSDLHITQIVSSSLSKKNIFQFLISVLIIFYSIFRSFILLLPPVKVLGVSASSVPVPASVRTAILPLNASIKYCSCSESLMEGIQ